MWTRARASEEMVYARWWASISCVQQYYYHNLSTRLEVAGWGEFVVRGRARRRGSLYDIYWWENAKAIIFNFIIIYTSPSQRIRSLYTDAHMHTQKRVRIDCHVQRVVRAARRHGCWHERRTRHDRLASL